MFRTLLVAGSFGETRSLALATQTDPASVAMPKGQSPVAMWAMTAPLAMASLGVRTARGRREALIQRSHGR